MQLRPRTRQRLLFFYISPMRTEGPEHLSSPWTQSCASGSSESNFGSGTLLSSCGERCRGELSPNPERWKCCSAGGSAEPPQSQAGGSPFFGALTFPAGPGGGGVSVQPHDPHSPSAEERASCSHPHACPLPLTLYLGSYIKGKAQGGCANGRAWCAANQRP